MKPNSSRRLDMGDFIVSTDERPDWIRGNVGTPVVGCAVYCAGGAGVITAVLGKTGDGSRLLEIRLADPSAKPFYAAASNVLLAPVAA